MHILKHDLKSLAKFKIILNALQPAELTKDVITRGPID